MKSLIALLLFVALMSTACQKSPSTSESQTESQPEKAEQMAKPKAMASEIEIPADTALEVRLDQALSTNRNRAGDTFPASLAAPVMIEGKEILPKGTKFTGRVTTADSSGRLQGRGVLGITLDSFELKGQSYPVSSSLDTRTTEAHKKRNLELIGGGAGLGALIGGLTGGGKGAAIGAGAGAAAGTAGAAATGKKDVNIPPETIFRFKLKSSVKLKA